MLDYSRSQQRNASHIPPPGKDSLHSLPILLKQFPRRVREEDRAVACLKKPLVFEWVIELPGLREK